MKNKLSVTIITKNEEANIERCLKSIRWVDEIIIVDSGSEDRTLEICESFNCEITRTHWKGFGLTKRMAVDLSINNWILSLDADEEVTDELKKKIQKILELTEFNGYRIKRKSFYLGKMINHCGWNRDYTLRLFNKNYGNFNEKIVHESVQLKGKIGLVEEILFHYTYPTIGSHIRKIDHYSSLGAKQAFGKKRKTTITSAVFRGLLKFIKMYFLQKGFLDGKIGLILSINSAYGVFLKYLKLWEMTINDK